MIQFGATTSSTLTLLRSHDRRNVEGFCAIHTAAQAQLTSQGFHVATQCKIPVRCSRSCLWKKGPTFFFFLQGLNLTLASWFLYGLAERNETWYMDAPRSVEDRLNTLFSTEMERTRQPSLIVLSSSFWDLRYFSLKAEHEGWESKLQRLWRPATWTELAWHRKRLATYVQLLQNRFPGVPIMFRLGEIQCWRQILCALLILCLQPNHAQTMPIKAMWKCFS